MGKQPSPKENPLWSRNIPQPPDLSPDPRTQEEGHPPVLSSSLPQNVNTAKQQHTGMQQSSKAVQSGKTAQREKMTFYLEPEQANKLYDFMEAWRHRTGVRINQQDMLRRIIDVMTIDAVLP